MLSSLPQRRQNFPIPLGQREILEIHRRIDFGMNHAQNATTAAFAERWKLIWSVCIFLWHHRLWDFLLMTLERAKSRLGSMETCVLFFVQSKESEFDCKYFVRIFDSARWYIASIILWRSTASSKVPVTRRPFHVQINTSTCITGHTNIEQRVKWNITQMVKLRLVENITIKYSTRMVYPLTSLCL